MRKALASVVLMPKHDAYDVRVRNSGNDYAMFEVFELRGQGGAPSAVLASARRPRRVASPTI